LPEVTSCRFWYGHFDSLSFQAGMDKNAGSIVGPAETTNFACVSRDDDKRVPCGVHAEGFALGNPTGATLTKTTTSVLATCPKGGRMALLIGTGSVFDPGQPDFLFPDPARRG
jgi:hypothetical protein